MDLPFILELQLLPDLDKEFRPAAYSGLNRKGRAAMKLKIMRKFFRDHAFDSKKEPKYGE